MEFDLRPRKLDLYIVSKFISTFFVALLLIIGIVIIFDISEKIDDFVEKEAPLGAIIFDYYLNFIPYFMNMFSPMFVFITVIFFTSKMAADTEIVAILSCGISFHRLMVPYMFSATLIAILSLCLNLFIIPDANKTRLEFEEQYFKNSKTKRGLSEKSCGERGIRTPETLLEFTRFPGVPLQPLEHLSFASAT